MQRKVRVCPMLKKYAKSLRQNQTAAELRLWQYLRGRRFQNYKFRRQQILQGYIVDFVCLKEKLIIELDGGQHGEAEQVIYDNIRTNKLEQDGFRVLRFWSSDMPQETEAVLETIYQALHPLAESEAKCDPSPLVGEGARRADEG